MTARGVTESVVEQAALAWFFSIGWAVRNGVEIDDAGERGNAAQCLLNGSVRVGAAVEKMAIHEEGCSR